MISPAGWEKRLIITLFITLFLLWGIQTPAMAFGPQIVDVTTKAFSAVWTTAPNYTDCNIIIYEDDTFTTPDPSINRSEQIIVETASGNPGEDGRQYGIAKVTVVGLDIDTEYYFKLTENGSVLPEEYTVRTEKLRGLSSTDPNDTDIVSNPIVHKAVYHSNGTSPAIGALVIAEIYDYEANFESVPPPTPLSDYPISAWVGDGMIGDEDEGYNPNNISYKQYAALNTNNVFEETSNYPLSLEGDNPDTANINEAEIIKFTIVHGTQSVLGEEPGEDHFFSFGRVESTDKMAGDKITTSKVSASFNFKLGSNSFTFPFNPTKAYTTRKLWEEIEAKEGIVKRIYVFKADWVTTYKVTPTYYFNGHIIIEEGNACIILMDKSMNEDINFYGDPRSSIITLPRTAKAFSIPQLPSYKPNKNYQTKNMWLEIEALEGVSEVVAIYTFINDEWVATRRVTPTYFLNSIDMNNSRIYTILVTLDQNETSVNWDPFPSD